MEKTIAVRLFTWFENVPDPLDSEKTIRTERIAHLGQTVDINDDASLKRGEELGAFFSDEDAEAIASGSYRGPAWEAVSAVRAGTRPSISAGEDSSPAGDIDVHEASSDELGEYIRENGLTVQGVKDLVPDDADVDLLEKFYDAENYATDNDPRKGVMDFLDARIAAASGS